MTEHRNALVGYLTSQYPAPSHTFIRREIAALRRLDVPIRTYSIRRPPPGSNAALDRDAEATTFYVLSQSVLSIVWAHLVALVTRPLLYWTTLLLALRHRVPGLQALLLAIAHFAESVVLARQLRRDGVTHLHNHFANSAATVGLLTSRFLALRWSLTLHGISETDYPAGPMLPGKIAAADFVACASRFGAAQAMRISPPSQWSKFHIVRCGVDLGALPQASEKPGSVLRIICVGRLSSEKGHAGLLEAFAALRARQVRARLVLVGDGPEAERLKRQIDEAGLTEDVALMGRLDEAATLAAIADSDMLVLPSFMEGLPVVLMEAMALGVPVVASRVAGIPELVSDGESGLLFHPADWVGLTTAMERLAADPGLRRRLGSAGRLRIEEEFAIDRAVIPLPDLLMASRTN